MNEETEKAILYGLTHFPFIDELVAKFRKCGVYKIPFQGIPHYKDGRIIASYQYIFEDYFKYYEVDNIAVLCYNTQNIIILEEKFAPKFTIEIPYYERSNYYKFIYEINKLAKEDDFIVLAVNNIMNPCSYLIIETESSSESIRDLIKQYDMKNISHISPREILAAAGKRQFQITMLGINSSLEEIKHSCEPLFFFNEKHILEEKGYDFTESKKKKIFISYCHKNKDEVYKIVDCLEESGLSLWIDKKQIDIGDNILDKVSEGINECDLHLIILSKYTKEAVWASHELKTLYNRIISSKNNAKKMVFVKTR